jgi:leader peptidase (prepilin peptidase)/N-methyltransferase
VQLVAVLQENPAVLVGVVFVLGLLIGSFLNVVILRLPVMMEKAWRAEARQLLELPAAQEDQRRFNLVVPRSACPECDHQITWYENIPVISWLALRGKCAHCGARISARYPFVELVAAITGSLAAVSVDPGLYLLFVLFATWSLLAMAMIDFDTTLLPDQLTYPFLWAGLLAAWLGVSPVPLHEAVLGAMIGYLILWGLYWTFKLLTGKEGMGYGDFKLLAGLGAWVGWQHLPVVLLLASVAGAFLGILLIQLGVVRRDQGIPFGPWLAAAGWITLLWGPELVRNYLQMYA